MTIAYIAHIRLPTEKAHGMQIMKSCEALANAGHTVMLAVSDRATPITEDPFSYYAVSRNFTIRKSFTLGMMQWGRFGYLLQALSFAVPALLSARAQNPDVIYTRDEAVAAAAAYLGIRNIVWESHDGAWNWLARVAARHALKMIVVTEGAREFYISKGVSAEKIAAIPNGVDVHAFSSLPSHEEAREELHIPSDVKVALYAGAFDGWKGVDTLFAAAEFLPEDVRIVAVGGRPEVIEKLRARYPKVLLYAARPARELPRLLAAADVCVLPNTGTDPISVRFTCPLKLLAYMAAGKPIVASDLPSVRELTGTQAALLVPSDDPKALATAILRLTTEPEQARVFADTARGRSRSYDWTVRAERIARHLLT